MARDGERLAAGVRALPELGPPSRLEVVAGYVARPGEPSTDALLAAWRQEGRRVLLPVVRGDRDLDWAADDGTRGPGAVVDVAEPTGDRLGLCAVHRAAVVVVPALAVDLRGARLGQGGGSYDRALARVAADALVVALLHDDELVVDDELPDEPHDRPVDAVVTPARVVRLTRAPAAARAGHPQPASRPPG